MRIPMRVATVAITALLLSAGTAMGAITAADLVADPAGGSWNINNTTVNLFEPPDLLTWPSPPIDEIWRNNNWSPVVSGYPDANVPSPGGAPYDTAERFDLEGLFFQYHQTGNVWLLSVIVVTSMGPNGVPYPDASGPRYYLGDVFLDVDGGGTYDYALLGFDDQPGLLADGTVWVDTEKSSTPSTNWYGTGREAGRLVDLTGTNLYGINGFYSYASSTVVKDVVNPWAVSGVDESGISVVGGGGNGNDLRYEEVTPAGAGDGIEDKDEAAGGPSDYVLNETHATYVYRWDVVLPQPLGGLDPDDFDWHITVQCGNDVMEDGFEIQIGGNPPIPAPGALLLGMLGAGIVALRRLTVYRRMRMRG